MITLFGCCSVSSVVKIKNRDNDVHAGLEGWPCHSKLPNSGWQAFIKSDQTVSTTQKADFEVVIH